MSKVTYPFRLADGGCSRSSHWSERNDCVIIAFAIVTQLSYDRVYEEFKRAGRRTNCGFESDVWLKKRGGCAFGGIFKKVDLWAGKPRKRLTVHTFSQHHSKGRFLIETIDHVLAVIDGVHRDTARTKEQNLTGIWQWFPGKGLDMCSRM